MSAIKDFVTEMSADRKLSAVAAKLGKAYRAIELEGIHKRDARNFLRAVDWIISAPRTLDERLTALDKLMRLPKGHHIVSLKQLTGW